MFSIGGHLVNQLPLNSHTLIAVFVELKCTHPFEIIATMLGYFGSRVVFLLWQVVLVVVGRMRMNWWTRVPFWRKVAEERENCRVIQRGLVQRCQRTKKLSKLQTWPWKLRGVKYSISSSSICRSWSRSTASKPFRTYRLGVAFFAVKHCTCEGCANI